ncbi:hypothetical protein BIW11_02590 [Tropilaelaps mercedesae]|uniref:Uncharacterized protein n=1 Tax=Tropilaelaps mercedesae TaxID=418985 RepID=A0A1V9Y0D3_9ACAR|nr:hypothetical protein BIW11_02590 [Tropilaelaps mercedesae]
MVCLNQIPLVVISAMTSLLRQTPPEIGRWTNSALFPGPVSAKWLLDSLRN